MAVDSASSVITNVTEMHLNNKNFNEKDCFNNKLDISNNSIPENYDKTIHNQQTNKKNVEENLIKKITCNNTSLNQENIDYKNEKLQNNDVLNSLLEDNNLNKNNVLSINKKSEVNIEYIYEHNDNTVEKMSKNFLKSVDNNLRKPNSYELSNKELIADDFTEHNMKRTIFSTCKDIKKSCFTNIIDSESEDDINIVKYKKNKNSLTKVIDSESEDDLQTNNINDHFQTVCKPTDININGYQALIDSESEEEMHNPITFNDTDTSKTKSIKKKSIKKKKNFTRAAKDEAMHHIHSETQRLLRETQIFLPYHKPKQHTLQEFLNRKKLLATLPKASSRTAKLKMSSAIVSQVLEEKEKEAEIFYKSSDSENDMQQDTSSPPKDIKESCVTKEKISSIDIYDIQKIDTNNQHFYSKKELVEQSHINLDFSNKNIDDSTKTSFIFEPNLHEVCHKDLFSLIENNTDLDNSLNTPIEEVETIHKQKLERINRKLFDSNFGNETNEISNMSYNQEKENRQTTEELIDNITSSDEKQKIDKKESQISKTKNQISETHQCDFEVTNENENENLLLLSPICNTQSKVEDSVSTENCKTSNGDIINLPPPNFIDETLTDKKKLLKLVPSPKVMLKGLPGTIIDLSDDTISTMKDTLLNSFIRRHVGINKQTDNKSKITVTYKIQDTQKDPTIPEIQSYKLSDNTDNFELNKPGAKLMRLKENLRLQMSLKRRKEWKQKEIELRSQERKKLNKEKDDDNLDDNLDEEEETINFELSDSEESEPEENDICIKDKKGNKCLFVDDEAEVTEDENSDANTEETYNESDADEIERNNEQSNFEYGDKKNKIYNRMKTNQEEEEDDEEEKEKDDDDGLSTDMETESKTHFQDEDSNNIYENINAIKNEKDKKLKQLVQINTESQDNFNITNPNDTENKNNNSLNEDESDSIPAVQQHTEIVTKSQMCKTPLTKKSIFDFVSPVTQLSILDTTSDSTEKDISEKIKYLIDKQSMGNTQNDTSPEYASTFKNKTILQKKLFDDIEENINDEYLMQLCSGTFESTNKRIDLDVSDISSQSNIFESQLYSENCNTELIDTKQLVSSKIENKISQNIKLTLDKNFSYNSVSEEEEVDNIDAVDKNINVVSSGLKLKIVSSDDESQSDESDFLRTSKKRRTKKLYLSDSEEENVQSSTENDVNNEAEDYVDYDSEENEIVVAGKDKKTIAADFLEEEAELSESDWNSADEDEKDMDQLEFEEADDEHIDEHEVKDQLEKIHVRQIMDEDKREVRLLKELLFEDGDLHSDRTGRERKFRWKNIDKLENNTEIAQVLDENDGGVDVQEDGEEAKWNKFKHEKDKFLEERKKSLNNEIEDDLNDSQIFKLGLEALKKIESNDSQKQNIPLDKIDSENMEPIMPRNIIDFLNTPNIGKKSQTIYNVTKRRSLLNRREELLSKIASLAKQNDLPHTVNTKNFVFQYIDRSEENNGKKTEKQNLQNKPQKRKISDSSLKMKKIRR